MIYYKEEQLFKSQYIIRKSIQNLHPTYVRDLFNRQFSTSSISQHYFKFLNGRKIVWKESFKYCYLLKCRSCNVYWLRNHTNNSSACDCTYNSTTVGGSQGEEEIVLRWALWDYDTTPYWKALVDTYKSKTKCNYRAYWFRFLQTIPPF